MSWGARDKTRRNPLTHRNPRRGRSAEAQARAAPPGPYTECRRAETGEATPESAARSRAHLSSTRCGARPLATGTSATAPKLRRSFLTTAGKSSHRPAHATNLGSGGGLRPRPRGRLERARLLSRRDPQLRDTPARLRRGRDRHRELARGAA